MNNRFTSLHQNSILDKQAALEKTWSQPSVEELFFTKTNGIQPGNTDGGNLS